ncbi:MAG TPA: S49 family peptidase [Geminicoccaceae bacterium]|nr:S49 family peptidase [Geminicoccaceae bacterium]
MADVRAWPMRLLDWLRARPPAVPIVRLTGVIGGASLRSGGLSLSNVNPALERAFKLRGAKAVALSINSPGGSPVQSALIAGRIRALAAEKKLPVVAFIEDVGASGGYWLALAADEIFADPSSIVGSIGVIHASFGFAAAIERLGIERRLHTAGAKKSLLDPFRPERPDDVERLHAILQELHQGFKATVRGRRGARLKGGDDELFEGQIWTGRGALAAGLIDGLGDLHAVLRERFGEKVRLPLISTARPWWQRRLGLEAWPRALVDAALDGLAERELWSRYGL